MKERRKTNSHVQFQSYPCTLILAVLGLVACNNYVPTHAAWIDPDTPERAHITRARGKPPPQREPVWGTPNTKRRPKGPTPPPTPWPTYEPSPTPTNNPTPDVPGEDEIIYKLVMSDEFNVPGRSFQDGYDPKWTALDKNDYTNGALHYYSPDNVHTNSEGDLLIKTEAKHVTFVGNNDTTGKKQVYTKNFKSAMLQTWNKFCFTGGIVEAEIELPGKSDTGGLWPAFWLLGNMARHTYVGSTNHIWPWSSNVCTSKSLNAQRISGCMKSQHYGLHSQVGRGAPEIDIFEVQAGKTKANEAQYKLSSVGQPFMSASYQVAPGRSENRPGGGWWPGPGQWYEGLTGGANTSMNILFYGDYNHFRGDADIKDYWSDAVSFNHQLTEEHFQKKHKYRVEWDLPDEDEGTDGYIRWYVNDRFVLEINGTGIVDAGVGSTISTEPMYILMNTAVSTEWGFPLQCPTNCNCKNYDCLSTQFLKTCGFSQGFCEMMKNKTDVPTYKVNYVRVYQNPKDPKQKVGCSTPERPTSKYIEAHEDIYKTKDDAKPLKPIPTGTGKCEHNAVGVSGASCGGSKRGFCTSRRICECESGWTGPHCLVPVGSNPIIYEKPESLSDLEFTRPIFAIKGIWTALLVMGTLLSFSAIIRKTLDRYRPLQ